MHQNMWMAAIEQLKEDGLEGMPVPDAFPDSTEFSEEFSYTYLDFSPTGMPHRVAGPPDRHRTARESSGTTRHPAHTPRSRSCRRETLGCTAPTRGWCRGWSTRSRARSPDRVGRARPAPSPPVPRSSPGLCTRQRCRVSTPGR
ncbi:hypothetical protein [Micromonospora sp. DT229]|uniref:hypothetical protein n=1 Tax=Micromonospora sp. DT229 TaxID=3393430 RepID=UPI003CED34D3